MTGLRPDLQIIAENVTPGARVLDIGCGDGALMAALRDTRQVRARGLELDPANVSAAVARGLSVIQGDADTDLADYPSDSVDYAILSQTLQPESWYDTPNIHHVSIEDFRDLIAARGWTCDGAWFLSGGKPTSRGMANLLAEHAVFLLRR